MCNEKPIGKLPMPEYQPEIKEGEYGTQVVKNKGPFKPLPASEKSIAFHSTLDEWDILFNNENLPEHLAAMNAEFAQMAKKLKELPNNTQRVFALQFLKQAKDAALCSMVIEMKQSL